MRGEQEVYVLPNSFSKMCLPPVSINHDEGRFSHGRTAIVNGLCMECNIQQCNTKVVATADQGRTDWSEGTRHRAHWPTPAGKAREVSCPSTQQQRWTELGFKLATHHLRDKFLPPEPWSYVWMNALQTMNTEKDSYHSLQDFEMLSFQPILLTSAYLANFSSHHNFNAYLTITNALSRHLISDRFLVWVGSTVKYVAFAKKNHRQGPRHSLHNSGGKLFCSAYSFVVCGTWCRRADICNCMHAVKLIKTIHFKTKFTWEHMSIISLYSMHLTIRLVTPSCKLLWYFLPLKR